MVGAPLSRRKDTSPAPAIRQYSRYGSAAGRGQVSTNGCGEPDKKPALDGSIVLSRWLFISGGECFGGRSARTNSYVQILTHNVHGMPAMGRPGHFADYGAAILLPLTSEQNIWLNGALFVGCAWVWVCDVVDESM